jgi:agmatine deiminase
MPAEWAPHRGTWLSWPHRESSWPGKLHTVFPVYAEMVRHLASSEEVHINVSGETMEDEARQILLGADTDLQQVFFHHHPTDDAWCRDHGPIFLQRDGANGREELILDWGFNAWGGKYPPFDQDDVIPTRIAAEFGIPVESPGIILEGGSIDVNGKGTLITTESCLLNPNRNPQLSRTAIEGYLRDWLGVHHILWLGDGIEGDDTDGHVDDLTRFTDARTLVTVVEADPRDENFDPLRENVRRLEKMTDQDGRPFKIVTLPMPHPVWYEETRLPASYANFYIANSVVLMPAFDPEHDVVARATLQSLFPTRKVVAIDCTDLVWGLGAFHCLTQQWPALLA